MDVDRGQELPIHPFPPLSYFGNILVPCVLSSFKNIHLVLITVSFSFHHMLLLKSVYPLINYKPNLAVTFQINFCWNTSVCLVSLVASSLLRKGMMGRKWHLLSDSSQKSTLNLWKKLNQVYKFMWLKLNLKLILAQKVLHIVIPMLDYE